MFSQFSSVQLLNHAWLFVTPWTAARQASLSITNSQSLLKLMSIELVMPSNHHNLCRPLLFLPSIFPSIRVFPNESALHIRWPKYWSFNISPSNEHPGLISFRMDWLDLLAVQGTLKSLLQHQSSKASILWHSVFFIVQLSHPYMTTWKTRDWCWSWNSNTLATWCKEQMRWKRYWCWERFRTGGEEGNRRWDGWMASLTQWTWVWVKSGREWSTGKPGVLQSMGSQRFGHDLATEQQETEFIFRK